MKWPRGKYNGREITGFRISVEVNVDYVWWKPKIKWNFGEPYFIWLIFYIRASAAARGMTVLLQNRKRNERRRMERKS